MPVHSPSRGAQAPAATVDCTPRLNGRQPRRTSYPDLSPGVKKSSRLSGADTPTWPDSADCFRWELGPEPSFSERGA